MTLNFGLRPLALKTEQQMSTVILNALRADLVTVLFIFNALLTFQFVFARHCNNPRIVMKRESANRHLPVSAALLRACRSAQLTSTRPVVTAARHMATFGHLCHTNC